MSNDLTYELELHLPPSINSVYVYNRYTHQKVYKRSGTSYLQEATMIVQSFVNKHRLKPFDKYFYLDMDFTLPRSNADSHNYKKLLMDVLEHGGLVTNDKFIMDRTQSITVDPQNPHVILRFTCQYESSQK